jgi:hypothetical protein
MRLYASPPGTWPFSTRLLSDAPWPAYATTNRRLETRRSGWCQCRRTPPRGAPSRSAGRAPCSAEAGAETAAPEVLIGNHPAERCGRSGREKLAGCPRQPSSAIPQSLSWFSAGDHSGERANRLGIPGRTDDVAVDLYEARDEASAQRLLGGQVPARIGATSNLFGIHVSAVDQLCEPSVLQAQSMVNVGNHLLEHPPTAA